MPARRTPKQQQEFNATVNLGFSQTELQGLIPSPPRDATLTKEQAYRLLAMSRAVAEAVTMASKKTDLETLANNVCQEVLSWARKQELLIQDRRVANPYSTTDAPGFVNHFIGNVHPKHFLIGLVSSPLDVLPHAFVDRVYRRMLISVAEVGNLSNPEGIVVVGHRDWGGLSFYQRMRTVEAAFNLWNKVQRAHDELVKNGRLLPSPTPPNHAASLAKFAPQSRPAGSASGRRASVQVFRRWRGL